MGNSFAYFSYKKSKRRRFGTQFQHLRPIKSTATPCFLRALSVGAIRPKPGHKGLFVKSPLESQKLCKNKLVRSRESSLAYLSFKKGMRIFIHYNCIKSRQDTIFIICKGEYGRQKTKSNESLHCFCAYPRFIAAISANI